MSSLKQLSYLTKRILKQNLKSADTIITVIGTPVFMLLFFVYVFGGNISLAGEQGDSQAYLNYSLPGFLLIAMSMGSAYTALRINNDKNKGFLNRLHSLPIRRWVILGSHVVSSVVFMFLTVAIIVIIGLCIGFRPELSIGTLLLFLLLTLLFAFAITLLAIPFSLKAQDYTGAGAFSYILIMLLFVSSALIPTEGMAKPIQLFADYQPMTPIVESVRALLTNTMDISSMWQAFAWLSAIIIMFGYFSYSRYQKVFSK